MLGAGRLLTLFSPFITTQKENLPKNKLSVLLELGANGRDFSPISMMDGS